MSVPAWLLFLGHFVTLYYLEVTGVVVQSENLDVRELEFGEAILSCDYRLEKEQVPRLEWKKMALNGEVSFVYYHNALSADLQNRAEMIGHSIRFKNLTRGDSGRYRCEVSAPMDSKNFQEVIISLNVLVAPGATVCDIPSSVTSGSKVELKCQEKEANPASEYRWFKNGNLLDNQNPNATYKVDKATGALHFNKITKQDTGEYYCEANNAIGKPQRCSAKRMQVDDLNLATIISATVIAFLVVTLCGCAMCYAQGRGYLTCRKSSKKDIAHKSASLQENDFKHTKSFVI